MSQVQAGNNPMPQAHDLNYVHNAMLDFAAKNLQSQVEQQVPVEVQTEAPKSTEESSKLEAQATPKEQPTEEAKPTEQSDVQQEVASSWDADEAKAEQKPKVEYDFSELGSALELGEVKTKEEFLTKASELKSKLKEYQDKPLAGIPDEFKEVIEVAKAGDWKDYLASQLIDYSRLDPVEEYETNFFLSAQNNQRYYTDGKFDPAKAEAALDAIPEPVREFQGQQMLQAKAAQQVQRRAEIKAKSEARLVQAEKSLSNATKDLNQLLPYGEYNIKFEPKHSSEIYTGITNSTLTKKHLGVSYEDLVRSGADMKAVAATVSKAEYAEKMLKFKAQDAKTQAKKEILATTQNAQIKSSGSIATPNEEHNKKSPLEIYREKLIAQQQGKGL